MCRLGDLLACCRGLAGAAACSCASHPLPAHCVAPAKLLCSPWARARFVQEEEGGSARKRKRGTREYGDSGETKETKG